MTALLWITTHAGVLFGAVLGACLASFGCVVAERLPRRESLGGRSHCACGRQLHAYENVPILGWLALRGRTRCCGVRLPARYLIAEVGLAAWCGLLGQLLWAAVANAGVSWMLAVAGVSAAAVGFVLVCVLTRPRA